jgi:hypothetical protein
MSETQSKEAGELPPCENCDKYSRARADAEAENNEKYEMLLKFIKMRQDSCRASLKEYVGSSKSQAEKFMAGLYRKEIAVYDDIASWAQFFLGIDIESDKENPNIK